MPIFDQPLLAKAGRIADDNWKVWQKDFEFDGDHARIPTLSDRYRFCCFCRDYSLIRHSSSSVVESVRRALCDSDEFRQVVQDTNGGALDKLAEQLPRRVPGIETERSLLSKLAAFARPDEFIAWDTFAQRGVHYLARRAEYPPAPPGVPLRSPKKSAPYRTYADYLSDVRTLLDGASGNEIRDFVGDQGTRTKGFVLRVLDCCLMIVGGRPL